MIDMFHNRIGELEMTAADVRRHLAGLQAERALALDYGVGKVAAYMADIDEEIAYCSELYVTAAVTEIATLRAELSGSLAG